MNIRGQLTWQDYLHAQSLHTQRVWWLQMLWYAALAVVVGGFLSVMIPDVAANGPAIVWTYIWLPVVIVAAAGLFYYVVIPRGMRKLYEQHAEMSAPFDYEITQASLVVNNGYGHADHPWGTFKRWKENQELLLLYTSEARFIIIPKRLSTSDQLDAARSYLRENNVSQEGIVTRRSLVVTAVVVFSLIVGAVIYVISLTPGA